jgi:hypothetical protein
MQSARGGELQLIAGDIGDAAIMDGSLDVARFNGLAGVAVDAAGNVYVADGQAIRKISTDGAVTTIAGRAGEWGDTDGGTANTVRKITAAGQVTTLAGKTGVRGHIDGLWYRPHTAFRPGRHRRQTVIRTVRPHRRRRD